MNATRKLFHTDTLSAWETNAAIIGLRPHRLPFVVEKVNQNGPIPEHRPELGPCWEWMATRSKGYGWVKIGGKGQSTHRVAWQFLVGSVPPGMKLDHQCHNRACVRPAHLRVATHKQNIEHRLGAQKNNTSGIRGVSWDKRRNNWEASVKHNGKGYHVGNFRDIADAEAAVIAKRNELFTHNDDDRKAAA